MLLRPVLLALAVGFAVSVTQYLPTLFVGGGRFVTLTTEAVGLAAGGDRRIIGVYAFLQALLPLLAFAAALALPRLLLRRRARPLEAATALVSSTSATRPARRFAQRRSGQRHGPTLGR